MKDSIYLDNNATTPIDPIVWETLSQFYQTFVGNPSSIHQLGQKGRQLLLKSRDAVAAFLKVQANEIIFTSGATEALNLAIRGLLPPVPTGHFITSSVEHAAVFETAKQLQELGYDVTFLNPGEWGAITVEQVKDSIRPETRLISLMAVNNETGVKTDIEAIASLAHEKGIPFLVDGVALIGKDLFSLPRGISAFCFSGHKMHSPAGSGVLFLRKGVKFHSTITGGEQEGGRRGGTQNLSGIVALAKALQQLQIDLDDSIMCMAALRDCFEKLLLEGLKGVSINGAGPRISNTSNLAFEDVDGETLLNLLDREGVMASHGSACSSGALEPSRILLNMGYSRARVRSSIRFSLSRFTTQTEIEKAAAVVISAVQRLRQISLK